MSVNAAGTAEWDQRQLYNMRMHELFRAADINSINDDYDNWFDSLRGVRRMIHHFLKDDEKKKVNDMVRKARRWAKTKGVANPEAIQDQLDSLHTELYDLAHKYRLLIPTVDTQGSAMDDLF